MNDIYCSYFDHNYLSRALLMIELLRRFEPKTPIYILTLSELCETILRELALPNVEIIPLAELEQAYPELASIKSTRKRIEYYFTLSPFLPHYLFAQTTADRITYIDGDIYFLHIAATGARFSRRRIGRDYAASIFVRLSKPRAVWPIQCRLDHLPPLRRRPRLFEYLQGRVHGVVLRQGRRRSFRRSEISRRVASVAIHI